MVGFPSVVWVLCGLFCSVCVGWWCLFIVCVFVLMGGCDSVCLAYRREWYRRVWQGFSFWARMRVDSAY